MVKYYLVGAPILPARFYFSDCEKRSITRASDTCSKISRGSVAGTLVRSGELTLEKDRTASPSAHSVSLIASGEMRSSHASALAGSFSPFISNFPKVKQTLAARTVSASGQISARCSPGPILISLLAAAGVFVPVDT